MRKFLYRCIPVLLVLAVLNGCGPSTTSMQEQDERAYRRGKSLVREGRHQEALSAFLDLIDARDSAPESHLEAGLIYLDQLNDPIAAIYHFRRYLEFSATGEHAEQVRELILTAKKEFARELPGEPFAGDVNRLDLMEQLKTTKAENLELKQEVVNLRSRLERTEQQLQRTVAALEQAQATGRGEVAPIIIDTGPAPSDQPQQPTVSSYTVQAGDTLSSISRKVYGNSARWMDIFQANRDQLPSPNALKPGQVLKIP